MSLLHHGVIAHQVLAVGSLLGVYSVLEIVNLVRPVAPTRFTNPPNGTLELIHVEHYIIYIHSLSLRHDVMINTTCVLYKCTCTCVMLWTM